MHPSRTDSHGCVRLPLAFSSKLWTVTHVGTPVIIAGSHSEPWELTHPGMVLSAYAEDEFEDAVASLESKRHPSDWEALDEHPVTTVIASTIDRRVELLENGEVVADGTLKIEGADSGLGSHVFVLNGAHGGARGLSWHAISHHPAPGAQALARLSDNEFVAHLRTDGKFNRALQPRMHPGMVMIVTDASLHPDRRSNTDFVIMNSA